MDPSAAPITVYRAWNSQQAQLLLDLFEEEGIEARVASSAIETMAGKVPYQMATCPVLVHQFDAERARAIAEQFDQLMGGRSSAVAPSMESICYHCGDAVAADSAHCPSCGLELDWTAESEVDSKLRGTAWLMLVLFILLIG